MNPSEPYYPDERNSGITQRNKLIFDIYVKNCDNIRSLDIDKCQELFENMSKNAVKAADILLEQLKKEEKQ